MITTEGFRDILHIARHKKPYNFSLQQELPWQSRPLVEAPPPAHGEGARDGARRRGARRRSTRTRCASACAQLQRGRRRGRLRLPAALLPQPGPRAAHQGDPARGVPGGLPLRLARGAAALPRVRALLDRVPERLRRARRSPRYVARFAEAMREEGFRRERPADAVLGRHGTVEAATQRPVNLLMSGPVAGLIGGIWAGRMAGHENVVTLDMGGTSADIGVAAGGELRMRHLLDTKVGDYQAMVPMVDIDTIGAGGGSIAYVDEGGVFRVGPQSAGADPGPACYGRGGTEPTSTDAQLAPRPPAARTAACSAARMQLDVELAEQADADGRRSARHDRRGGGARRAPDPEVRDDAGDRAQLGAPRLRPARVHARRRGRRGPAVRLRHRARARDPAGARPAAPGHRRGDRPARHRPPARVRRHRAPPAEGARPGAARARATTSSSAQARRPARGGRRRPRTAGSSGASPTAATRARATRCASTCRRARSTTPGSRSSRSASTRAHEAEYGHRFDARDRDRQHPRARRSGASTSWSRPSWSAGDGDPAACEDARARGRVRRRRPGRAAPDAVLRARRCCAPATGSRARRSSSSTTRRRSCRRACGRDRPLRQHRHRLHDGASGRGGARGRPRDADPHARDRRRLRRRSRRRWRACSTACRYSSIIRESEDLGAGIFDRRGQRARRVRLDADVHGRDAEDRQGRDRAPRRRHPRRRRHPPQRPLRRRHPLAGRRDRDPDLLRRRARRLRRSLGARARHRRRLPGPRDRPRRQLVGGQHLPRRQARRRRASGRTALWRHILENVRTPTLQQRRHPGDDRRLRAGQAPLPRAARPLRARRRCSERPAAGSTTPSACCARRSRRCPTGATRPTSAGSTTTARTAACQLPVKVAVEIDGRRDHVRPDRLERRGADRLQLPLRGHDRLGDDLHHADDLPRRGDLPRLRARRTRACSRR